MNFNVLLLTTHFNTGGITTYLLSLTRGLIRQGDKVFVISSGGNCVEELIREGARHFKFNIHVKSELSWRLYFPLGKISRLIEEHQIDVIHANTRVTQVMGVLLGKMTRRPYVSTCHGFFKLRLSRRIFPCWGDAAIAISPAVKEHLEKDFRVPADRVALVLNGIKIFEFPLISEEVKIAKRREQQISAGPVIGIIARLADVKGHAVLIQAMISIKEKFPKARLMIVGEGKMEERLKSQVKVLNLQDHVFFYPVVNRAAEFLCLFDVFAMPSLEEGLGISIMEAQSSGIPVVASRVGGIPSIVEHGETGLLVEPGNPDALAQAIIYLLENPDKAKVMGQKAHVFIRQNFTKDHMATQTKAVYQQCVEKLSSSQRGGSTEV